MESLIARIARNEENPVNRDLPRFTEIYRVFKVFIAVNQVSFSSSRGFFTELYLVLSSFKGFLPSFRGFYRVLPSF